MENNQSLRQEENVHVDSPAKPVRPGECLFSALLTLFGLGGVIGSLDLYAHDPTPSGYAVLPLVLSTLLAILGLIVLIRSIKAVRIHGGSSVKEVVQYLFPKYSAILILLTLAYCVAMFLRLNFIVVTFIYLFATMAVMIPRKPLFNLITSIITIVFLITVFRIIFNIVFP